jgi:hypothetical protein
VTVVDRLRVERVVVAGQDDDRLSEPPELTANEGDRVVGHPVVIEQVAGDQQQVHLVLQRPIDDARPHASAVCVMRGLLGGASVAITVEMNVGRVQHAEGASRWGHVR